MGTATAYNLQGLKFLVVDDNEHMCFLVRTILRSLGVVDTRDCRDGFAAYEELRQFPADIVICDWDMAPLNGLEFTRMVRTTGDSPNAFVPIIMLTGYTEKQRVVEARDAGINEFLAKPISAKTLYGRVRSIIEFPRPFIRAQGYFGPDRRRRRDPNYEGPERRQSPPLPVEGDAAAQKGGA